MIILKIFSNKDGGWKNLTDILGFDPDPETKYKNKHNRNFVGRWGRDGKKQMIKGKRKKKDKQQMNNNSATNNSSTISTNTNINNSPTVKIRPPKKKWWENIKKPTSKQIRNAALITTAATGTAVGSKYLYDKYKDYEQLKLIKNYRKRFES